MVGEAVGFVGLGGESGSECCFYPPDNPVRCGCCHSLCFKVRKQGTSLVAQWLRIRLPVQGTRVRALVREDPTCQGALKPVRHNY